MIQKNDDAVESHLPQNVGLPETIRPEGKLTIEITDAETGELIDKSEKKNFISKGMESLYKIKMKELYQRFRATGGVTGDLIIDPFRYLYLTDADHDSDPDNEWFMRGKVVGVADTSKSDAWGGKYGGQYNDVESFTREDMVRIVIDFPASAANGTVNSVYFLGGNFTDAHDFLFRLTSTDLSKHIYHNGKIYGVGHTNSGGGGFSPMIDSYLYVHDLDYNLLETYTISRSRTTKVANVSSMVIRQNRIYFTGYDVRLGSESKSLVWSISLDDLDGNHESFLCDRASFINHITFPINYPCGITYDPDRSRYVCSDSDGVRIYDNEFNILHNNTFERFDDDSARLVSEDHRYLHYHDGTYFLGPYTLNPETGYLTPIGGGQTIQGFTPDGYILGDNSRTTANRGYLQPKIGISSRAKLSSPVTKTSANNMKVTYDFILPSTTPREDDF